MTHEIWEPLNGSDLFKGPLEDITRTAKEMMDHSCYAMTKDTPYQEGAERLINLTDIDIPDVLPQKLGSPELTSSSRASEDQGSHKDSHAGIPLPDSPSLLTSTQLKNVTT